MESTEDLGLVRFAQKLSDLVRLTPSQNSALAELESLEARVRRHRDAITKGEKPSFVYVVLEGWAARYSLRHDGSRRITGFLLPGDFCGIHAICGSPMDHAIVALTDCRLAKIDPVKVKALIAQHPAIGKAFWQAKLVDEATLRRWLLNSADASRTLAHLICELEAKLYPRQLTRNRRFKLPITQDELGDSVGMTGVHVNRTLRALREANLVTIAAGTVTIPDIDALRREAEFDISYLRGSTAAALA